MDRPEKEVAREIGHEEEPDEHERARARGEPIALTALSGRLIPDLRDDTLAAFASELDNDICPWNHQWISLATVSEAEAQMGAEVSVIWGEPGGGSKKAGCGAAPVPGLAGTLLAGADPSWRYGEWWADAAMATHKHPSL